jgi:Flp pilus assembly pilin Flp
MARDERGAELLEYALIAGLIILTAIATVGTAGTRALSRWSSVNGAD